MRANQTEKHPSSVGIHTSTFSTFTREKQMCQSFLLCELSPSHRQKLGSMCHCVSVSMRVPRINTSVHTIMGQVLSVVTQNHVSMRQHGNDAVARSTNARPPRRWAHPHIHSHSCQWQQPVLFFTFAFFFLQTLFQSTRRKNKKKQAAHRCLQCRQCSALNLIFLRVESCESRGSHKTAGTMEQPRW